MIHGFKHFLYLIENKKYEFFSSQSNTPIHHIEKLAEIDPNPKKKNLSWLVKQHKNNNIRRDLFDTFNPDDKKLHSDALDDYEKYRNPLGSLDKYKDVHELKSAIVEHKNNYMNKKFGNKIFSDKGHEIWEASTGEHATNHGNNTDWCTRIKNGTYQKNYLSQGKLYNHYPPNTPKPGEKNHGKGDRYQWFTPEHEHTEIGPELRNHEDDSINPGFHKEKYPEISKSKPWKEFIHMIDHHTGNHDDNEDLDHEHDHIRELAHSDRSSDRIEAIENHDAHINDYGHLWDDPDPEVKTAIIDHEKTKGNDALLSAHNFYKDDADEDIRGHVAATAEHPYIINHMINNHWNDYEVKHGLASNPNTPYHIKLKLADMHDEHPEMWNARIHSALAENPKSSFTDYNHYTSEIHHKLLDQYDGENKKHDMNESSYDAIARSVSSSSRGDKSIIHKMIKHHNPDARTAVAKYYYEDHFHDLKNDTHYGVHRELGKYFPEHYTKPTDNYYGKLSASIHGNNQIKDEIIANHPKDDEVPLRTEIAANIVRTGNAQHAVHFKDATEPNIVHELQKRIAYSWHDGQSNQDIHNVMPQLATSTNPKIIQHIANYTKHENVLHSLKNHEDVNVRLNLTQNNNLPREIMHHLADNDPNEEIRNIADYKRQTIRKYH